jgi:osmoprotectant transport system permease protein
MKGIIALCALLASSCASAQTLTVGSKRFTESYVLGEIVSQTANGTHKPGLGNTAILLEALKAGAIDVYPEYTGTIAREILRSEDRLDLAALNAKLKPLGLAASIPLGFSNSYALGMRRKDAERLGIRKVSDLAKHAAQRFGLSHEFLGRRDGWPGLQGAYGLPQKPRGLDHGIAYEALAKSTSWICTPPMPRSSATPSLRWRTIEGSFRPTTRCCSTGWTRRRDFQKRCNYSRFWKAESMLRPW